LPLTSLRCPAKIPLMSFITDEMMRHVAFRSFPNCLVVMVRISAVAVFSRRRTTHQSCHLKNGAGERRSLPIHLFLGE
jgi:hypothetical protein